MLRIFKGVLAALCAAIVGVGYTAWSIHAFAGMTEDVPADAAIVLGAAAWGTRPSPVLRERVNHAITLYRKGLVRTLLFTGGRARPTDLSEAEVSKRYAVKRGVPATAILLEDQSRSTAENLRFAKGIADARHLSTFLLVSDPLHMKRSMTLARDLGMEVHASPTPTTMVRGDRVRARFLARETYFYLRYRLGGY